MNSLQRGNSSNLLKVGHVFNTHHQYLRSHNNPPHIFCSGKTSIFIIQVECGMTLVESFNSFANGTSVLGGYTVVPLSKSESGIF